VAVIGAGAFGGWTALHLQRLGAQVELIDAWGPGNTRSSSGGDTRVIRAVYGADRIYVELVKRAYPQWEQLAAATGEPLCVETGALWLVRGEDAYVRSSAPILAELGFPLEQLTIEDAARRWPQIAFDGVQAAWLEHRAGALSARRACVAVQEAFVRGGGRVRVAHATPGAIINEAMAGVHFGDGSRIEAEAYVFACGPWLGRVFPGVIGDSVMPTRQEIFYFGTPAGSHRYQPAHFPIWLDFGERIFYGMPDLHGRGVKVADDTRGEPIDPSTLERTPSAESLARARHLLAERFPGLANAPLLSSEVCQYENSPDGHLIVDRHPEAANVWLAGGGSGHGFKLAPAVGELLARAIVADESLPEQFRLARLRSAASQTQFERT
jgi:sarcosine oxidase